MPRTMSLLCGGALTLWCAHPAVAASSAGPPLLPAPVLEALAGELSGTNARHIAQEISLHHRMRGSRGFTAAAAAVRRRAVEYGLSGVEIIALPADGERFYGTQRSRPAWDAERAELWELAERDGEWVRTERIASFAARPVSLAQDSASGRVEADLVDVGEGVSEGDYRGRDVGGKLVLASAQPGPVARLAVARFGAAGIVSWAQNQKSAWWGEDESLVRWGHLDTFPAPTTFAFMVSPGRAREWRERLARGERVRLAAEVEAGQHPGSYDIVTGTIPGRDPAVSGEEIVFSCHLDHQRPGANDNASGCAAILEAARALAELVSEGRIPAPRRSLRFVWPPEIEGTIALLNARPELPRRARAVVHMDMVGGDPEATKAVFHVTRSPASLPTFVDDVGEAFGRYVDDQSHRYAATGEASLPLVDPEGAKGPLQARFVDFTMGSDHQIWTEGSFRVPAIYLNDWPDRTIHTDADEVANLDPTKLLRAAFIGAASGYYLADLDEEGLPELFTVLRRLALERAGGALARAALLTGAEERANLLVFHVAGERALPASVAPFARVPAELAADWEGFVAGLAGLLSPAGAATAAPPVPAPPPAGAPGIIVYRRRPEPRGPMSGFGYDYLEDRLGRESLPRPALLDHEGLWGAGPEYAYEALNLVDGERTVRDVRDALAAIYGPVPLPLVTEYLAVLARIGVLEARPLPEPAPDSAPAAPPPRR